MSSDGYSKFLSPTDEILAKAFEPKETIGEDGNLENSYYEGLFLDKDYRKKILQTQENFLYYSRTSVKSAAHDIDSLTHLIIRAIAKSLEIRLPAKKSYNPTNIANHIEENCNLEEVEKYLSPMFKKSKECYDKYHQIIHGSRWEKYTEAQILDDWREIGKYFKDIFPREVVLFSKIDSGTKIEISQLKEEIYSEHSPEYLVGKYEYYVKEGYDISDHESLLKIEDAYWEVGEKSKSEDILDDLITKYKDENRAWERLESAERLAKRLEFGDDFKGAREKYEIALDCSELFGRDTTYFQIKNSLIRCNIKSSKSLDHQSDTWERQLDEMYNVLVDDYGDIKLSRKIILTKILLKTKQGEISEIKELIDQGRKLDYLCPRDNGQFDYDVAIILLDNKPVGNDVEQRYTLGINILKSSKDFYESYGEIYETIKAIKSILNYTKNDFERENLRLDLEKFIRIEKEIEKQIQADEINIEFIRYLVEEKIWRGLIKIWDSERFDLMSLLKDNFSQLEKGGEHYDFKHKFEGELGKLKNSLKQCSDFHHADSENMGDYDLSISFAYKNYRKIVKSVRGEGREKKLNYLRVRILETEYMIEKRKKKLNLDGNNPKKILKIGKEIIKIWIKLNSKRGEYRWKRNLAEIRKNEKPDDLESIIREIRDFYREIDSRKYYHLSADYTLFGYGDWEDVINDPNIPDVDKWKLEFYQKWARNRMKEKDYFKALEVINEAIEIAKMNKFSRDLTGIKISSIMYGWRIECLIRLERFNDAKEEIEKEYKEDKINELKYLNFDYSIAIENGTPQERINNRLRAFNLIQSDEGNYQIMAENTDWGDKSSKKELSYILYQISNDYEELGEENNKLEILINKYNFDKKNELGEDLLASTARKITDILRKGRYEFALQWERITAAHNSNCGYDNATSSRNMGHLYIALSKKEREDKYQQYAYREKATKEFLSLPNDKLTEKMKSIIHSNIWKSVEIAEEISEGEKDMQKKVKWLRKGAENCSDLIPELLKQYQKKKEFQLWKEVGFRTLENKEKKLSHRYIESREALWKSHNSAMRHFNGDVPTGYYRRQASKVRNKIIDTYTINERDPKNKDKQLLKNLIEKLSISIENFYEIFTEHHHEEKHYEEFIEVVYFYLLTTHVMRNNNYSHFSVIENFEKNYFTFVEENKHLMKSEIVGIIITKSNDYNISLSKKWLEKMLIIV